MPSIFDTADRQALIARLERLSPDSERQWGKMSSAQMLRHCQVVIRVALGQQQLQRGLLAVLFGGMAKRRLLAAPQFQKNMPTAPEFRVQGQPTFSTEKAELLRLVQQLGAGGAAGLTQAPHPFFGALSSAEWDALQYKHLDHHLRQFGL